MFDNDDDFKYNQVLKEISDIFLKYNFTKSDMASFHLIEYIDLCAKMEISFYECLEMLKAEKDVFLVLMPEKK